MPTETFNISFESTQNKQQYASKLPHRGKGRESYGELKFYFKNWYFEGPDLAYPLCSSIGTKELFLVQQLSN